MFRKSALSLLARLLQQVCVQGWRWTTSLSAAKRNCSVNPAQVSQDQADVSIAGRGFKDLLKSLTIEGHAHAQTTDDTFDILV